MNRIYCVLCLILLTPMLYAKEQTDTVAFREELLFVVDCTVSDVRRQERPTPCLSIAHDSLIVFPSHRDTITFFRFDGTIAKKAHNKLNFFPTHIYYSDNEDLIYLMSVGTWSTVFDTLIYAINQDGEIKKKYKMQNGNIDQWFLHTKQLTKEKIRTLKQQFRVKEHLDYYSDTGVRKNVLYDLSTILQGRFVFMHRYTGYNFINIQNEIEKSNNKEHKIVDSYYRAYDFAAHKLIVLKITAADTLYYSGSVSQPCKDIEWYVTKKTIAPGSCGSRTEKTCIQVVEQNRRFIFTRLTTKNKD